MAVATGNVNILAKHGTSSKQGIMLPMVEHPQKSINTKSLSIRGESRQGAVLKVRKEKTSVAISDRNPYPSNTGLKELNRSATIIQEKSNVKSKGNGLVNKTTEEIDDLLKQKFQQGGLLHSMRHLFQINGPKQNGVITKEAFQKILIGLFGYISKDQVADLMNRIGIKDSDSIDYSTLHNRYLDKTGGDEWVHPVHKAELQPARQADASASNINRDDDGIKRQGIVSAPFCYSLLRERAKKGEFNIHEYFPPSCFVPGGVVIELQLQEFVTALGYEFNDDQFKKLWERYDPKGIGAAKTHQFLQQLGLSESCQPLSSSSLSLLHPEYKKTSDSRDAKSPGVDNEGVLKDGSQNSSIRTPSIKPITKQRHKSDQVVPKLSSAIDCLHYKFEIPYNALIGGMKCFDFLDDGFINVTDLKHVFKEYGFEIGSLNFDSFLSRCGIRPSQGQVQYEDLMLKLWNRSENSLLDRIVTNNFHCFGKDQWPIEDRGIYGLTAEQLQAKLMDYLHGDFLKLLDKLKKQDPKNLGVLTEYQLIETINETLGYKINQQQIQQIKDKIKLEADGLLPYPKFLELFNTRPGLWNRKKETATGINLPKVERMVTPPEVLRLRQKAKVVAWAPDVSDTKNIDVMSINESLSSSVQSETYREGRSLYQLRSELFNFFQEKFHIFDKVFKKSDRRMTGRLHKQQFKEILKQCDYHLSTSELNTIWNVLPTADDNMMNIIGIVRFFARTADDPLPVKHKRELEGSRELMERMKEMKTIRDTTTRSPRSQVEGSIRISDKQRDVILNEIKAQVITNWDGIKNGLRNLDKNGDGNVATIDMQKLLSTHCNKVSQNDFRALINYYDYYNNGRFHYMDLLLHYAPIKSKPINESAGPKNHQAPKPIKEEIKVKFQGDWIAELPSKYKSLRRAFKKKDPEKTGVLSIKEFKEVMTSCDVDLKEDDVFHVMSTFDPHLKGEISYEEFLAIIN